MAPGAGVGIVLLGLGGRAGLACHSGSVMGSGSARASGTAGNWARRGTRGRRRGGVFRLRRAAARRESQTSCGCWTQGSSRPALRAVTAARPGGHRAFRGNPQAICSCPGGDLNSRFREDAEGTQGHLASPLPAAPASRPGADSIRVHPDSSRGHHRSHHRRPRRRFTRARLTQRPRRGVSAPGGALTPSLRLTGRTGP